MPAARAKRRLRILILTAGVVLLAVLALLVLFGNYLAGELGLAGVPDQQLQVSLHEAFDAAGEGDVVDLDQIVADLDWDAVGVFGPYYPHESIVADMGVRVPKTATNTLVNFEGYCLLVFRDGNRAVAWTTVERTVAECLFDDVGVHPRDRARFQHDRFAPANQP